MTTPLTGIAAGFRPVYNIQQITPFGSGHINTSYLVKTNSSSYLLQRINHHVFPDVAALSANIESVTDHLRKRIATADGEAGEQMTLRLIPAHNGKRWHQDETGGYWRMYDFLEGLVSYDVVETAEQAYAGARSYGHFLNFLSDFNAKQLTPVLPDFHNVVSRLRNFEGALKSSVPKLAERVRQCPSEIKRVYELADGLTAIQRAWENGKLSTRVTHNDTKFNNVLLTPDGRGRAVVDLDTVMPGIVHFDYGDGIRTATATVAEDEADLQLLDVDREKYRAFTEGYLSVTRDLLNPAELHYLPRSGALLAYLMAVRFLTDYFEGDVYYTTKYPEHNLVRGRNQLKLAELLLKN
ncbi:phosphotransferase enzyme family protein [Neolewinella agarilytica]|uniref:Ser/Thr protein kinase RdoA involved in Cpx stress response, MazF antagonist n=1 Tax=Neolewinella agarilytica TaxID=478744 RepID=A0A1H9GPN6_9BACT|nr:aminoglycoside phosphotransferase family protein [Neolewinella agarilytica]SEQ52031.1 Ser/Thr protein kinase RdoA involved in Cpx stress response, MazF antagonist [Neolewinella agarilytica]